MKKPIRSEFQSIRWSGGRGFDVKQKIVDGPEQMLDRMVTLHLNAANVETILESIRDGLDEAVKQKAKVDAQNAENAENAENA